MLTSLASDSSKKGIVSANGPNHRVPVKFAINKIIKNRNQSSGAHK